MSLPIYVAYVHGQDWGSCNTATKAEFASIVLIFVIFQEEFGREVTMFSQNTDCMCFVEKMPLTLTPMMHVVPFRDATVFQHGDERPKLSKIFLSR